MEVRWRQGRQQVFSQPLAAPQTREAALGHSLEVKGDHVGALRPTVATLERSSAMALFSQTSYVVMAERMACLGWERASEC